MTTPSFNPPSRITVTTDDMELINDLRRGYESRELIDLFGVKFAATFLSVGESFPAHVTMRAEEVRMLEPLPWSGVGLPPVGTVCEVQDADGGWHRCEVLAHHVGHAVFAPAIDYPYGVFDGLPDGRFRPVKTPAQIAADLRQKAIEAAIKATLKEGEKIHLPTIGALYDVGLLKGEDQ